MTKIELARIACAIAIHRPDWPENSIRTFLERHLAHRPYHDVAVALTWIATDPDTQTPARVLEAGPWWTASRTSDIPRVANTCTDHPLAALRTDQHTGVQTCAGCWADTHGTPTPQPLRHHGVPPSDELRRHLVDAITRTTPDDATDRTEPS